MPQESLTGSPPKPFISADILELGRLAENWSIQQNELDIPFKTLMQICRAVSPGTTNNALHVARVCKAVKAGVLLALNPVDNMPVTALFPDFADKPIYRVPGIASRLDMEAVSNKRKARKDATAAEARGAISKQSGGEVGQ